MDGDRMVVDEIVSLVLVVYEMRTDAVPKGFGQSVFEIDPRIRFDSDFGLGGDYRLLLGIGR
jgi:hypothetical protein